MLTQIVKRSKSGRRQAVRININFMDSIIIKLRKYISCFQSEGWDTKSNNLLNRVVMKVEREAKCMDRKYFYENPRFVICSGFLNRLKFTIKFLAL